MNSATTGANNMDIVSSAFKWLPGGQVDIPNHVFSLMVEELFCAYDAARKVARSGFHTHRTERLHAAQVMRACARSIRTITGSMDSRAWHDVAPA